MLGNSLKGLQVLMRHDDRAGLRALFLPNERDAADP